MPRTITSSRTLIDIKLESLTIDFSEAGPGQPPLVVARYLVVDSEGKTFEAKRVGGKVVPQAMRTGLRTWWDQLRADILADEGL